MIAVIISIVPLGICLGAYFGFLTCCNELNQLRTRLENIKTVTKQACKGKCSKDAALFFIELESDITISPLHYLIKELKG